MYIVNTSAGMVLANKVKVADKWLTRLIGLLNRKNFFAGEALLIKPCKGVHTCFMRFSIDVLFLDMNNAIIGIYKNLPPFRCTKVFSRAFQVIELPAGTVEKTGTKLGDNITIESH
ncbi:hypothetical protein Tfer_1229 [Thermincola ferriacetica]|uniref:DUF192 domain-containing protein n=1 Tax=Thermincola ferriacetica TaxID=281456 RepID=A0A0L6W3Z3_9FIRM|nr:DUF192 domain-containing protein [Thermincola ferriacetica]KNZ70088.1 hypothetical protein Tfer_1229 [Thermincola ferriacetica]